MIKSRNSIFFIGLLSAFSLLTFDLYQPSLSFITHYFNVPPNMGQLSLSIYLLVFGIAQLIWGPLIDHYGRCRLLPASLIIAVVASLICVIASNIEMLIFGRALQGFALCCSNLVAFSTSRDFEDPLERAKIISYVSMIVAVSPIFAPVAGSLIFTFWGWQANFLLMALLGFILFLQSKKILFESPFWESPEQPFKWIKVVNTYKQVLPSPVIWCASMIMMFSFSAVMLSVINSSYLIMDCLGYSPLGFGIIFIFNGLNIIAGNYLGIWLRNHLSMTLTIFIGNWLIIAGGLSMLLVSKYYGFGLPALSCVLIANLGISVSAPPTMSLALADFPDLTGTALALINSIRMLGSSILSMTVGYLLVYYLDALPLGLIGCGFGALFFSWAFKRLTEKSDDHELDGSEAVN